MKERGLFEMGKPTLYLHEIFPAGWKCIDVDIARRIIQCP
jgi:hypothetical protein